MATDNATARATTKKGGVMNATATPEKLFEVPRVKILHDNSDPTVIKLAFSGSIELDRGNAANVEFYNALKAGQSVEIVVTTHVAGAKKIHRRDSEGDVDAIVETKGLVVSDVFFEVK